MSIVEALRFRSRARAPTREPADIQFSVGKVSGGGLLSWAQRWALEQQTLRLTVVVANGSATVSGTLEPF